MRTSEEKIAKRIENYQKSLQRCFEEARTPNGTYNFLHAKRFRGYSSEAEAINALFNMEDELDRLIAVQEAFAQLKERAELFEAQRRQGRLPFGQ